jgi:hypothetical protein
MERLGINLNKMSSFLHVPIHSKEDFSVLPSWIYVAPFEYISLLG